MRTRAGVLRILDVVAKLWPRQGGVHEPDALLARARALGAPEAELAEPLGVLLRAFAEEAALSPFGDLVGRWDVERFLGSLERLAAEEARAPDILAEPIAAPLIVTGLPRSGTTFLHGLLAEDPGNQAPRCWQTVYPYPAAGRADPEEARARRVGWQLRSFAVLAPDFRSVHPLDSRSPQECTEITGHVFQSLRFDTTHRVPTYRRWLDANGHGAAYRFHRRFLQHLQHQGDRRRWVLKCPDHVFALDALHEAYPDARMVFVHRDPLKVLPSVARLTEVLRGPFSDRIDRLEVGAQVLRDWRLGADRMIAASRRWDYPSPEPFHVHYHDLVAQPVPTIERLYRHFGMELGTEAGARMAARVAAHPDGGYGRNAYHPADYGLDLAAMRPMFAEYMDHFAIASESRAAPPPAAGGGAGHWITPSRSRAPARP